MSLDNPKPPKPGFPAKIPALRRALARDDTCPECGWELDTGWECNECGYDARDEAYPPEQRERDKRWADEDNPAPPQEAGHSDA